MTSEEKQTQEFNSLRNVPRLFAPLSEVCYSVRQKHQAAWAVHKSECYNINSIKSYKDITDIEQYNTVVYIGSLYTGDVLGKI